MPFMAIAVLPIFIGGLGTTSARRMMGTVYCAASITSVSPTESCNMQFGLILQNVSIGGVDPTPCNSAQTTYDGTIFGECNPVIGSIFRTVGL